MLTSTGGSFLGELYVETTYERLKKRVLLLPVKAKTVLYEVNQISCNNSD